MITPFPHLTTPSPAPTTVPTTTLIPALLDFSSLFGFDQRVSTLEMELSQLKQADHSAQLLESVKSQLPTMILPKEVSDFTTPKIQNTITESLENVEKSKSYRAAEVHKNLYDALIQSYQLDKDLFDSYGKSYSLKRSHEDKDKDEDPPARPDQGLKKRKKSKDAKPLRSSKSKDSQSSSSKSTKSQSKSSGKSAQADELVFETADTEMLQDQGDDMGNTEDQPNVEATSKHD
ncbi:hypothetical protein Tco_0835768 [Tanacetum coccineum]